MIRILSVYILFTFSVFANAQESESELNSSAMHYVIDDLFVYMHAGPGREYRIVGSINAGTPVSVIQVDDEAEYTEVEDDRGRTGWLETRFVTAETSLRQQIPLLQSQLSEQNDLIASRESDIMRLQQEIASIQEVETRLRRQLNDLQVENTQINAKLQENDNAEFMDWFMKGGGVALGGVLLGLIISAVFKRRKRDQWM
ncbi:MAG: TIGR04211 family SH3 domain-containing protein [Aestuariibacter sp.]